MPIPLFWCRPNLARDSRPMVYTYTPNFIWIHSLCHLTGMKTAILDKCCHLVAPISNPFRWGPDFFMRVNPLSMLTCQIWSRSVYSTRVAQNPKVCICQFWNLAFCIVANWRHTNISCMHVHNCKPSPIQGGVGSPWEGAIFWGGRESDSAM